MNKILYYLVFYSWRLLSALPAWVHYGCSSMLSAVLFYIIRYRRKLVHRNMQDAFPHLSQQELWQMERRFYLHFCDILIESLMYFGMSDQEVMKRMRFINTEQVVEYFKRGRSIGTYLGHYGNWEWISSLPLWVKDAGLCTQLYHPLENPVFDKVVSYTRERFGGKNIPVNESIRHMVKYKKDGTPIIVGFIADQVPFWNNIHYFSNFLNHPDTPVFTSAERLMKKLDMVVFYLDVKQVKRGYYTAEFKLMTEDVKSWKEFELTERYTRLMEETILANPALWLWTHNRWKRTKQEWLERRDPVTGNIRLD